MTDRIRVTLIANCQARSVEVEVRETLADLLRTHLGLTGTHLGCEQGSCGACTVLVDGRSLRACLMLAVQAQGLTIETVEGLSKPGQPLHPIQQALSAHHALQCGFCTPGVAMTLLELLREGGPVNEARVRTALAGHLCRCTGYQGMIEAALSLAGAAPPGE
jgi:aerobic-type carbon monoxide dehydrogenase small subunit (CoxS/CutS family)